MAHDRRRTSLRLAALACSLAGPAALAQEASIPQPFELDRYRLLWEKSPFSLSSAATEEVTPGFAENLVVVGTGAIGDKQLVYLLDKTSKQRQIVTAASNSAGISLVSLEPDEDPLKTRARIKKGTEEALVRFDPALLNTGPTAAAAPIPLPGRPPAPPGSKAVPQGNPPQTSSTIVRRRPIIIPSRPPTPN